MKRNKNIDGFVDKNLIDTSKVLARHTEILLEMQARGYNHQSPIENQLPVIFSHRGTVYVQESLDELKKRCLSCYQRITSEC